MNSAVWVLYVFDSSADQRHIDTPIFTLLVYDEQCCLGTVCV